MESILRRIITISHMTGKDILFSTTLHIKELMNCSMPSSREIPQVFFVLKKQLLHTGDQCDAVLGIASLISVKNQNLRFKASRTFEIVKLL